MSDNAYLVWLVAMAIVTVTVLTVGTLIASGTIRVGRRDADADAPTPDADRPGVDAAATADAEADRNPASTRRAA